MRWVTCRWTRWGRPLLPVDQRPLRARQCHPDLEQELRRLGQHLRRSDHRDCDPGPSAAPLDDDQHPRRKLSAEGPAARRTADPARGADASAADCRPEQSHEAEPFVMSSQRHREISLENTFLDQPPEDSAAGDLIFIIYYVRAGHRQLSVRCEAVRRGCASTSLGIRSGPVCASTAVEVSGLARNGKRRQGGVPRSSSSMSLEPAIPRRVGLHQSPPPLHRPIPCCTGSAETVNHYPARAGEFSRGEMGKFQPALTLLRGTFPLRRVSQPLARLCLPAFVRDCTT